MSTPVVLTGGALELLKARYALLQEVDASLSDLRTQQEKLQIQRAAIGDGIINLLEMETGLPIRREPFSIDLQRGLITLPDDVSEPPADLSTEYADPASAVDGHR